MTAPTWLEEDDDDLAVVVRQVGHDYRRDGGRLLHLASCRCWQNPAPAAASSSAPVCPYCETQHEAGRTCRWRRWLSTWAARRG